MQTVVGYILSIIKRKPMVCYIVDNAVNLRLSNSEKKFLLYSIYKKIQNFFVKKSNLIFIIDNSLKTWLLNIKINENRIKTINYGVNPERFKPTMNKQEFFNKYGIPLNKIIITYAGGNQKHHGVDLLLKSSDKIYNLYNNIAQIVVATGIKKEYLNKYNKYVKFLGWIDFTDYVNLINYSDILICPPNPKYPYVSIITNKLMQYMITGNAVIATNVGGIKNIVKTEETGILVNRNSNEIFEAIKKFINNKGLRQKCGENAKKNILRSLNWDINVKKILDILIKIANK